MGSFSTTCFVSQQTISEQDRAIIIPIAQETSFEKAKLSLNGHDGNPWLSDEKYSFTTGICYPTDIWNLAGPQITGKYADYGEFEIDDTPHNKNQLAVFFNMLHEKSAKVEAGKNSSHEPAFDFKSNYSPTTKYDFKELTKVWSYFFSAMQNGRVFVANYKQAFVPVYVAVMHQSAAQYLIDSVAATKNWDDEPNSQIEVIKRHVKSKIQELNEMLSFREQNNPLTNENIANGLSNSISVLRDLPIGSFEGCKYPPYRNSGVINHLSKTILDHLAATNQNNTNLDFADSFYDKILYALKPQLDLRYLLSGLHNLNVYLSPMVTSSQDYDNTLGNAFLKMAKHVNKEVNDTILERSGEKRKSKTKP